MEFITNTEGFLVHKILLFLLPILFLGCSSDSSSGISGTAETEVYTPSSSLLSKHPMLVIRLTFSDEPSFNNDEASWQQKIFGNTPGDLNHYYSEISAGQFTFSPIVNNDLVNNGIVTLDINNVHPNPCTDDGCFETDVKDNLHPVFKTALEQIDTDTFDFSIYDLNGNGAITSDELTIMFILAGQEDAYSENFDNGIWAHEWCTNNNIIADGVSLLSCADNGNYAVFGERHNNHDATIGIIAHELGHAVFHLPDLYYGNASRIGYYGLMSMGSWGQASLAEEAGATPTHMCAWSKIDTGWYRANAISTNTDVDINASGTNIYNIIKVPLLNTTSEYFLVENRGLSGYDAGLNVILDSLTGYTGGIAIWHIDAEVIRVNRASNTVNISVSHKGVDLEEADGASVDYGNGDPSQNLYYSGNVNAFTPNTSPNSDAYNGTSSGVSITNISTRAETMTAHIEN